MGYRVGVRAVWALVCLFLVSAVSAAEPFRFTEAQHGRGELKYIGHVPVLTAEGTPEEIGEQMGKLLAPALENLMARQEAFADGFGFGQAVPVLAKVGTLMLPQFPRDHRQELRALCKASGTEFDLLVFGNVMYEYAKATRCSVLLVEASRSQQGGPLFGRNLDFPTFGFLDQYSLLLVCRPQGKHAYASVTFPGLLGCVSAMNDQGLCLAQLDVNSSKDEAIRFDPTGVPLALCFRRVLEECSTVDEAETLLKSLKRNSLCNLAVADARTVAVLEITTKTVIRRPAVDGWCACTNHFRTDQLATGGMGCRRYAALETTEKLDKLSLGEIAERLHAVNQGENTIQSMIFEPAAGKLHLSIGHGPASARPMQQLNLRPLLSPASEK